MSMMLNCKEATKLLSDSLEQPLPLLGRAGLKMHLLMCRFCSRFEKQLLFMRQLIHLYEKQRQEDDHPSPDSPCLTPEARERMKKALREDTNS